MKNQPNQQDSQTDIRLRRSERWHVGIAIPLLFIALLSSSSPIESGHIGAKDLAWAGILVLAMGILLHSAIRSYQHGDELQKRVRLQAAALSFGVTIGGLFVAGLLQALELLSLSSILQMLFIGSVVFWSITLTILDKKSRL